MLQQHCQSEGRGKTKGNTREQLKVWWKLHVVCMVVAGEGDNADHRSSHSEPVDFLLHSHWWCKDEVGVSCSWKPKLSRGKWWRLRVTVTLECEDETGAKNITFKGGRAYQWSRAYFLAVKSSLPDADIIHEPANWFKKPINMVQVQVRNIGFWIGEYMSSRATAPETEYSDSRTIGEKLTNEHNVRVLKKHNGQRLTRSV